MAKSTCPEVMGLAAITFTRSSVPLVAVKSAEAIPDSSAGTVILVNLLEN
jgi:hypothetical protein